MAPIRAAALAGHFGRDVERSLEKILGIIGHAHDRKIDLLVLPDACLGGYIGDLNNPDLDELPPALDEDGPELSGIAAAARSMTVCVGYTERAGDQRYNAAVCLTGDGVLGSHRKVHQPAGESLAYSAGNGFSAFDTPVGRMGMLIDYDKTFPESSRTLALDGARIVAALSAWPASVTDRASKLANDRQSRLFDLYDAARAAENQVVLLSSNHTGVMGSLRFLGQAKVVGPGGDVLCRTRDKGGLACCDIDVDAEVDRARRVLRHLDERRPDAYHREVSCASHF
ncbi:acyltransferase [Rhodococcus sp. Leaf7]|uniref:carbon-nitrogen hydrolase family protein n=1 Tax=unclassified Rhodococcus (in: high G+C Gram-positive bacteria) TaxID=192944 RepID=UPI0006F7EB1A|nr:MULTISPECIES: carbon-nitrogen hydrolase family protein [unclassified Rhodococcus (in: high G+C Gram-positive bacteria)]KQU04440.1 acyltransferase [Rhodococcus sp. Leaf7]KQU40625.1 acyltransferase [Rhodococcus sp. Leaf247]